MKKYFKTKVVALALSAVILVPTVASAMPDYGCDVVRNGTTGYVSAWGWTTYAGHQCRVRMVVGGTVFDKMAKDSISGSAKDFASAAYYNNYIDGVVVATGSK